MESHKPTTRVNTLRGKCHMKPLDLDIQNWLDETLCIQEDELVAVEIDGRQRCIFIKLISMVHYERIMRLAAGTPHIRMSTGGSISVNIDIELGNLKIVHAINLPVEVKNENILRALQHYCEILPLTDEMLVANFQLKFKMGVHILKIELTKDMSSIINIRRTHGMGHKHDNCPTLLQGTAPATWTWAQTLAAGQHTVTSGSKTNPTDTRTPVVRNSSVHKSQVHTPMHDDTRRLLYRKAPYWEMLRCGRTFFLTCPCHRIDADDMLEDVDMTEGPLDPERKEKKPRHKNRSSQRDVVIPERPQSQCSHSLAIARKQPTPPDTETVELAFCVNVYAPFGAENKTARMEFFRTEILPFLGSSRTNVIFGGDLNCVLLTLDHRGGLYQVNMALQELTTAIQVEDVVVIPNIPRPHLRCHSRCLYLPFSRAVYDDCPPRTLVHGRNQWRLKTRLVTQDEVDADFRQRWMYWVRHKQCYADAANWWECCITPGVWRLLQFHGARCRHEQASVLYFYEQACTTMTPWCQQGRIKFNHSIIRKLRLSLIHVPNRNVHRTPPKNTPLQTQRYQCWDTKLAGIRYADDVTCIVLSEEEVARINDILSDFTHAATA
ncbi:hypothetical protein PR048_016804 [Dryococelus australis]|uniref:Reverse transcriptase domain-containing protein n=1 Tax=Dryococelus australis TaxID=614101 RepID=A0ABQ9H7Q1_9NEOP|nr:hypothetical protein PR048_016804 [Dryococelus australis]